MDENAVVVGRGPDLASVASRAASEAALSNPHRSSLAANTQIARNGRAVIRDAPVHEIGLPLAEGN